jgi:hypothetical protein
MASSHKKKQDRPFQKKRECDRICMLCKSSETTSGGGFGESARGAIQHQEKL